MLDNIDDARVHIEAALAYAGGTHTFDDIKQQVESGQLVYWALPNAVIITEIQTYPQKKVLLFFLAGGNLAELTRAYPFIEQWGREQGCTEAGMIGRPGWQRTFLVHEEGWEVAPMSVYKKALSGA